MIREKHVMNSLLDMLVQDVSYQMKNPGLRSTTADGKLHRIFLKTLFLAFLVSIELHIFCKSCRCPPF